jgi:hypothetical protein
MVAKDRQNALEEDSKCYLLYVDEHHLVGKKFTRTEHT